MRYLKSFNQDWLFMPSQANEFVPDTEFESVTLPHSNRLLPHHYFDSAEYSFISIYRKHFTLPENRHGRRVYLDFDGAMIASTVTINGHRFSEYRGGYTPFSFDISDFIFEDKVNTLTVELDSCERPDIPPFGHVVDYLSFGGIYRDVWIRMVSPCHIHQVFIQPKNVLSNPEFIAAVEIKNQAAEATNGKLRASLVNASGETVLIIEHGFEIQAETSLLIHLQSEALQEISLWSINQPYLYKMVFELYQANQQLDSYAQDFGFREAVFKEDGRFYLNGEAIYLFGLNRHQNFPYLGAAAPARLQRKDAEIIK
jgi:beta-galactosidase